MFVPGEGTVCPGMAKGESGFAPPPLPASISVVCALTYPREQEGESKLFVYWTLGIE